MSGSQFAVGACALSGFLGKFQHIVVSKPMQK
jgi:hypothetical protein